jgi:glycerol-3-phosphate dehydrogenase (NAD(P)+)
LNRLAVIGSGSWGTALARVLAPRFDSVHLWAHDPGLADRIRETHSNDSYLPGFNLPPNIEPTSELPAAIEAADCVLLAVPSQHLRGVFRLMLPALAGVPPLVSATKGIETHSLQRMSEVLKDEASSRFSPRIAVLSGPTFAREVARGEPAALVIASTDADLAQSVQHAFSGPTFRLYTNDDPAGVEIGASLKNVIAIGAGIVAGLGLGNNTVAALVTRGLAEITRLAVALGGKPATLAGLAGLGDLVLTCTGDLSRNRRVGIELAKGRTLDEILASTNMVAEGVETTSAAVELARRCGVEMPITEQMYSVLKKGKPAREGIRELMERTLKSE